MQLSFLLKLHFLMQYGLLIPFEPLFPTSFQDWKNLKWDWHRSWIIWERRVRKRDSLFWKVRALLRQDMKKFLREPSEPAGRQGAVLCCLLHTKGDGPEIPGCWNLLVYVHQMLDLYLVLTSTSGSEGSRGFSGAAKFVGIFIHSLHWMTPLLSQADCLHRELQERERGMLHRHAEDTFHDWGYFFNMLP